MFSHKHALNRILLSCFLLLTAATVHADEPLLGTSDTNSSRGHPPRDDAHRPPPPSTDKPALPTGQPPLLGTLPDDKDRPRHRDDRDRYHDRYPEHQPRVHPYPYYYPYGYRYAPPVVYPEYQDDYYEDPGSAPITTIVGPQPDADEADQALRYEQLDAWDSLSHNQVPEALYAFENDIIRNPQSALPRVGYALTVAQSGNLDGGAREMAQALNYDLADLHNFRADGALKLIIDDLLINYADNNLMTAALLYLEESFAAADATVDRALQDCANCTAARNLKKLIRRKQ